MAEGDELRVALERNKRLDDRIFDLGLENSAYAAMLEQAERERDAANARIKTLEEALKGLLMHCGIADAAPEDKDEIDHAYERAARQALSTGGTDV